MTPAQLNKEIQAGKFAPAYYFYGTEDYRIVEAEKYVASHFLPQKLMATNFRRLDGKRTPLGELLAELAAYPMLGERQVYAVSNFQHYKPKEIERVLKMISPKDKSRVVIMSSPSDKKPRRDSAFLRTVTAVASEVEFKRLTEGEVSQMIRGKLSKSGLTIGSEALTLLMELIAGDRGALESECDKLIDFKDGEGEITVEEVRSVAAGVQTGSVFEIGDCVATGNTQKILEQFRFLIADGTSPTGILFFLGQHYLALYAVKNGRALEPQMRWLTDRYRKQAEVYDNQQLESITIRLAETDAEMRRARVKPELLLEMLVLDLVRNRPTNG